MESILIPLVIALGLLILIPIVLILGFGLVLVLAGVLVFGGGYVLINHWDDISRVVQTGNLAAGTDEFTGEFLECLASQAPQTCYQDYMSPQNSAITADQLAQISDHIVGQYGERVDIIERNFSLQQNNGMTEIHLDLVSRFSKTERVKETYVLTSQDDRLKILAFSLSSDGNP